MLQVITLINDTLEGLVKGNISSIVNEDVENVTVSGPPDRDWETYFFD